MLIITALMVMLLALEIYYQGKDDMREANTVATHELEEANLSIMNTMMDIEESVKAVSQLAWTRADSPEAMAAITESLLNTGNQIVASQRLVRALHLQGIRPVSCKCIAT